MRKLVTLRARSSETRVETFRGREHLVVPVIALVEGVMQAVNSPTPEFVSAEVISSAPQLWNGQAVIVNHPEVDGELVSANSPKVLENNQIGQVFNSEAEKGKLALEAWVDTERAAEIGGTTAETIDRLASGDTVEVSVGVFVDVREEEGEFEGKAFEGVWTNIAPDHLAILEEGKTGACSVADGCGTNRMAEGACPCGPGCACQTVVVAGEEEEPVGVKKLLNSLRTALNETMALQAAKAALGIRSNELSDIDRREMIEGVLTVEAGEDSFVFAVAVFETFVVYHSDGKLFKRSFSIEDEKDVSLGDDTIEVVAKTNFVPVEESSSDDKLKGNENVEKEAFVKSLIESDKTRFEESDEDWLMSLEEGQLESLEPQEEEEQEAAAKAEAKAASQGTGEGEGEGSKEKPTDAETAETYIASAPEGIRDALTDMQKTHQDKVDYLVKGLIANPRCTFSEEKLNAMSTEELEALAKLADVPDYSARGLPSLKAAEEDDPNSAPPMPLVFEDKAAA